jgi:hypothetical protein
MFEVGNTLSVGRPKGSKNVDGRRKDAAIALCEKEGWPHPLYALMRWAMDETLPLENRIDCMKEVNKYWTPKPRQTVTIESGVPSLSSEAEAENFIAQLIVACSSELEPVELAALVRHWISSKREGKELNYKLTAEDPKELRVVIEGGLPALPATNVIMPKLNGHAQTELPPPDKISGISAHEAKDGEP